MTLARAPSNEVGTRVHDCAFFFPVLVSGLPTKTWTWFSRGRGYRRPQDTPLRDERMSAKQYNSLAIRTRAHLPKPTNTLTQSPAFRKPFGPPTLPFALLCSKFLPFRQRAVRSIARLVSVWGFVFFARPPSRRVWWWICSGGAGEVKGVGFLCRGRVFGSLPVFS